MQTTQRAAVRRRVNARGFSLLEVMIVIAIILMLGGLVAYNLMGTRDRATQQSAQIELRTLRDALNQFNLAFGRFPTEEEGVAVLWNRESLDAEADSTQWREFLMEPKPNDPWGTPWGYRPDGERGPEGTFDLWSLGPDKQEGTADDIHVWRSTEGTDGERAPARTGG